MCSRAPARATCRGECISSSSLPRTDNGKLRRNALPDLLSVKSGLVASSAPRIAAEARLSPLEGALAGLWSSLLEGAKVGRDDDFFLLGGDSLRGMQLIAHLETLFGVELPIQSLFGKAATVAGMARAIEAARAGERASDRRSETAGMRATDGRIHPRQESGPLPLSHTQMRMWFIERLDKGSTAYNLTSAHRLTGSVDVEALRESLRAIVQRHEILRTTYTIVDDEPRQIVHATAKLDFRVSRSSGDADGRSGRCAAGVDPGRKANAISSSRSVRWRASGSSGSPTAITCCCGCGTTSWRTVGRRKFSNASCRSSTPRG